MHHDKFYPLDSKGFSLLEVLFSLAIFSIALFGLLDMQLVSVKTAYLTLLHAQGQIQLINLAEQCIVTYRPDNQKWQETNEHYFPNSQSEINNHRISLFFKAYQQSEYLTLEVVC